MLTKSYSIEKWNEIIDLWTQQRCNHIKVAWYEFFSETDSKQPKYTLFTSSRSLTIKLTKWVFLPEHTEHANHTPNRPRVEDLGILERCIKMWIAVYVKYSWFKSVIYPCWIFRWCFEVCTIILFGISFGFMSPNFTMLFLIYFITNFEMFL